MTTLTYAAAGLAVVILAVSYHGITEHHWHLRYFWRYVRPATIIPPTRHDTRWHAASHQFRAAVNAGMLAAAILLGAGWQLQPRYTTYAIVAVAAFGASWTVTRYLARRFGERHPAHRLED